MRDSLTMSRSPVFEMAMTATDGQLIKILDELRAEGFSPDRISSELAVRYGVIVTGPTIKAWTDRYLEPLAPPAYFKPLNHSA